MSRPLIIHPRAESVEGQPILRPLPSAQCRSVGPFVFFDHMLDTRYAPRQRHGHPPTPAYRPVDPDLLV